MTSTCKHPQILLRLFLFLATCATFNTAHATDKQEKVERMGDVVTVAIPLTGFMSTLFYEKGWEGSEQFLYSFFGSQLIIEGLKRTTSKIRPNGLCCSSFPSGHSGAAFSGAAFIHRRYGYEVGIPAYAAAGFAAYSRNYAEKHYRADVLAGGAIGVLTTFYFTTEYEGVTIAPVVSHDSIGVNVFAQW